ARASGSARASSGVPAAPGTPACTAPPGGGARPASARPGARETREGRARWARCLPERPLARRSRRLRLPRHSADEERTEVLEVERGLPGLPHALDDDRERVELGPEEPDDEIVVVPVEPVAREADVVAEPGATERHPDAAVLHQDRVLLLPRQALERAR